MQRIDQRSVLMTIGEVARYLRIHRSTVYRLVRKGELPAFKVGDQWRFDKSRVDDWLSAKQQAGKKRVPASGF
jgi:excisionase family DNA binding protein